MGKKMNVGRGKERGKVKRKRPIFCKSSVNASKRANKSPENKLNSGRGGNKSSWKTIHP